MSVPLRLLWARVRAQLGGFASPWLRVCKSRGCSKAAGSLPCRDWVRRLSPQLLPCQLLNLGQPLTHGSWLTRGPKFLLRSGNWKQLAPCGGRWEPCSCSPLASAAPSSLLPPAPSGPPHRGSTQTPSSPGLTLGSSLALWSLFLLDSQPGLAAGVLTAERVCGW